MEAEQILKRALIFLEFDKVEQSEKALNEAIAEAEKQEDIHTLVSAMCCLGDLLYSLQRDDEAKDWLQKVMDHHNDDPELADEFAMAREFLAELQ